MAEEKTNAPSHGRHVQVNGLNMYYEDSGSGDPLIMVHGGASTALGSWEAHIPILSQYFRVLAPDNRGHGKTDNPSGELSCRLMADDIAAFTRALGLDKPFVCGWSDGGQIALELGMRYPDLPGALVVGAAWYRFTGPYLQMLRSWGFEHPGTVDPERIQQIIPESVELWRDWHAFHGPEYWKELIRSVSNLWLTPLDYTDEGLFRITAPTLILIGDRDQFIPVEQAIEMYRLIPCAELAVVPNANHSLFREVDRFTSIVLEFFLRHRPRREQG